jgi:glucokinase
MALSAKTSTPSVLVADIGGTHARFGLAAAPDFTVTDIQAMRCADHASLHDAALVYLAGREHEHGHLKPSRAAFAIACTVTAEPVRMTNCPWVIARAQISAALGLSELKLLNDFEAVALSLPALGAADLSPIGGARAVNAQLPMAAIGPGTGLGVALCVPAAGRWIAIATEGGHVTASAANDFEAEVLRLVRRDFEHVSSERLLSGIGLPVLYQAVARVRGEAAPDLGAEQITGRARDDSDPVCVATVDTFFAMLGTFAGNVALTAGARGGVFIAGGIAQRLADRLARSRFRECFEAKGRFRSYLADVATCLITAPHCGLLGAAQAMKPGE